MNKTTIKSLLFAAFMACSMGMNAQTVTFAGITAEQNAQNTPDGWTAVSLPQLPEITTANTYNITDYGASTSAEDNTKAIQKALDAVPSTGGMVVIPAGTWLCGALKIPSKTILHLAKNCTLLQQPYGTFPNDKTNFITEKTNATDIVIEGEDKATSIFDGQGEAWWRALDAGTKLERGSMIRFTSGTRFLVRNLTFKNAPGTNVTLGNKSASKNSSYRLNATVHDVNIYAPASELSKTGSVYPSHNTDGIPIWDPYVNIYNCDISNGDDNVVCDSYSQYIHVWNCDFGTGHGASVGSYTKDIKHVWFDNITMNGTTSGIRLKTGINSDNGTLRGGGEEDFRFTNFTMTKVPNPFSMDCYYDKNYSSDPATDKANAREFDKTTPTYNGILLQNVKTTDVCTGKAIFLVGRPESHIKNVTLDNVQISAKTGIDIRFVDNLVFKNGSKINVSSGKICEKAYDSTFSDECGATSTDTAEGDEVTYTISQQTAISSSGDASPWTFSNGCTVSNTASKTYAVAKSNTIKYSKGTEYTINLPANITITSVNVAGYANEDYKACTLAALNGETFGESDYTFPSRTTSTSTDTNYTVTLTKPATGTLTFTPGGAQAAWVITLNGTRSTSGLARVQTAISEGCHHVYDMSGRMVKANASAADLNTLANGVYIYNNSKFVVSK